MPITGLLIIPPYGSMRDTCRTVVDTANTHSRFPFFVTHAGATAVAPVCVTFIGPAFWPSIVFDQSQLSVPRYSYISLSL